MNKLFTATAMAQAALGRNADREAERYGIECLLNCVLREYAQPRGEARFDYRGNDRPPALRSAAAALLRLRVGRGRLVIGVTQASRLGRCHFATAPFHRAEPGAGWVALDLAGLARLLLPGLHDEPPAEADLDELLDQIANSRDITALFLKHVRLSDMPPGLSGDSLRDSEQVQPWGHALHPTPKSRDGVDRAALLDASPETGAAIRLHWFAVDERLRRGFGVDRSAVLASVAGAPELVACHPWEVSVVQANPAYRRLLAAGRIEPLGPRGLPLYPTSSVRTLHHPDLAFFLKMSIHVRLTNCVRKNAWYELESAVRLTQTLGTAFDDLARSVPGFAVLREPSASTIDGGDDDDGRRLAESFGILYREQIPARQRDGLLPRVAMSLFTWSRHEFGRPACIKALSLLMDRLTISAAEAAELWLSRYVRVLAGGVFEAHLRHGIVLEPHLQNVLIGTDTIGLPSHVWVRDLEGTKLLRSRWSADSLRSFGARARDSVLYDDALGWQRTVYCLLVNNIAEAVFHLSMATGADEERLWAVVHRVLIGINERLEGHGDASARLAALCGGAAWAAKTNLATRLHRLSDRRSGYVALPSPFGGRG